jgi:hypothetical protein
LVGGVPGEEKPAQKDITGSHPSEYSGRNDV